VIDINITHVLAYILGVFTVLLILLFIKYKKEKLNEKEEGAKSNTCVGLMNFGKINQTL